MKEKVKPIEIRVSKSLCHVGTRKDTGDKFWIVNFPYVKGDNKTYSITASLDKVKDVSEVDSARAYKVVTLGSPDAMKKLNIHHKDGSYTSEQRRCDEISSLYDNCKSRYSQHARDEWYKSKRAKDAWRKSQEKSQEENKEMVRKKDVDLRYTAHHIDADEVVDYRDDNDKLARSVRNPLTADTNSDKITQITNKTRLTRQDNCYRSEEDIIKRNKLMEDRKEIIEAKNIPVKSEKIEEPKAHTYKPISTDEVLDVRPFNELRGVSYKPGMNHVSKNGVKYEAGCGSYGFSESELALLDSGDYIIVADNPSTNNSKLGLRHFKISVGDEKDENGVTKLSIESIDINDKEFCDVKRNEHYRMNQGMYHSRLSGIATTGWTELDKLEKENKNLMEYDETEPREVKHHVIENPHQPTLRHKAFTIKGEHYNSYDRLNESYMVLRSQPSSEKGKALGFETKYDERRLSDKQSLVDRELKKSDEQLNRAVNELKEFEEELEVYGDRKTMSEEIRTQLEDTVNERKNRCDLLSRSVEIWSRRNQALNDEVTLRQMPCQRKESEEKGCTSAWEESVIDTYESLKKSYKDDPAAFKGRMNDESVKLAIFNYQRVQESIRIRELGFESQVRRVEEERMIECNKVLKVELLDEKHESYEIPDFLQ